VGGQKDDVGIQVPKGQERLCVFEGDTSSKKYNIYTSRILGGGNGLKKKVCLAFRLEKKNKCVSSCSSFEMFPLSFDV